MNKKSIFIFLVILVISISLFMVTDHIVNYKTWGINGNGFRDNIYEDYDQTCDIHYFEEPDNCRVVDDDGVQVSEELVILINPKKGFACFSQDRDTMTINRIPCFDALP